MHRHRGLQRFSGAARAALAGGCLRGGGAQRLGRVREESRNVRGQPRQAGYRGWGGFDRHRDGGQRLPAVTDGREWHAVGRVVAGGHGDGGRSLHHSGAVHVRPGRGQLVVQRVPGGGEGRQSAGHLVLSGDDVLDGERVLEAGRLRDGAQVVSGRHLRKVRGCVQRAQPQLGLLLQVVRRILRLAGGQRVRGLHAAHLEAFPAPQEAPVLEHVSAAGVQSPEAALAGLVRPTGDLDEAIVEREVVAQRVLPALRVFPVVREPVHDELVNLAEWEHLLRAALDGHGRQGDVRVRRLLVAVRVPPGARHFVLPSRTGIPSEEPLFALFSETFSKLFTAPLRMRRKPPAVLDACSQFLRTVGSETLGEVEAVGAPPLLRLGGRCSAVSVLLLPAGELR